MFRVDPLGGVSQYFENSLLLMDTLSCDLQDEVNTMGYGAAEVRDVIQNGRQDDRHLGFYQKFNLIRKIRTLQIFFAKTVNYNILVTLYKFLHRKKVKNTHLKLA